LAQLKTSHTGLRGFLFAIKQSDIGTCACGETESVQHFLFQFRRWDHLCNDMIQVMGEATSLAIRHLRLEADRDQVSTDGKSVDGELCRWK
jgi:hypothetical protein